MGELYDRISDLCDKKGISRAKMCREVGIQPSIMTDLKMGRQSGLSAKTAQRIASYFGVSVAYLLGEEDTAQSGEDATLQKLKDSPAARALLHTIKDMSEDEIRTYTRFIKALRAGGEDGE